VRHGVGKPPSVRMATVKWFNVEKRYGFLIPDDHSGDLFVHGGKCQGGDPIEGQRVHLHAWPQP
jgi:cold shock CspA family protein